MSFVSLFNGTVLPSSCTPSTFQYPTLQGADFLTLNTNYISNFSAHIVNGYYPGHPSANVVGASFCNVSVSYTRPGQNNTINAQVWLPTTWNGRMQGIGGGGFGSGLYDTVFQGMYASVGDGFATVSNDAGLPQPMNVTAPEWALTSTGNVNLYALQNFASISLSDGASIAKSVIRQYYGQNSSYGYWSGCSGGGRQGMMLAQEAPDAYDGIMAGSPAMNWPSFFVADYWPQAVQQELGVVPLNCELDALSGAAVAQCDGDDGLIDGVISFPERCKFDPRILVGTIVANCSDTGASQVISPAAATVALAAWDGAKDVVRNESLWYGFSRDAMLTTESGLAGPDYFISPEEWVKRFIFKDANADTSNILPSDVAELFHKSVQWYQSLIGTADPNLDEFKANGGKIVSFHGLVWLLWFIYTYIYIPCRLSTDRSSRPTASSPRGERKTTTTRSRHATLRCTITTAFSSRRDCSTAMGATVPTRTRPSAPS